MSQALPGPDPSQRGGPPLLRQHELPVVLMAAEDGGYVVEARSSPDVISEGDTCEEALANTRDAIELGLANQAAEGWKLPEHVEVVKIAVH